MKTLDIICECVQNCFNELDIEPPSFGNNGLNEGNKENMFKAVQQFIQKAWYLFLYTKGVVIRFSGELGC